LGVLPAGTLLHGYEIHAVLGQGAFGITYLGRDPTLGRAVAIKEYLPTSLALREGGFTVRPRSLEIAEDFAWGRERFLEEARTLARLEDAPAVVRVLDFVEANGTAYMIMALARGETLEQRIKRQGPLSAVDVERLLFPLLDGLEQVHATGFLHRDIKPANIILDSSGRPVLIDFGASRAAMIGRSMMLTAVFTPGYAAAEQITSAKQGPWTDIYALSATLYHAISGSVPPSAFERVLEDEYRPSSALKPPGFAPALLAGIDAGLAPRAADRPQSIAEWRPMFRGDASAENAPTIVMRRNAPSPRRARPAPAKGRRSLLWGGALGLAVLLVAAAYVGGSKLLGTAAVQTMTSDELSQALQERRRVEALAAEKTKLEEDARAQAMADAEAKRKADADLATAQAQRRKAEEELAKLKADIEARQQADSQRREEAAAAAQRALDEAARKNKAEAEMAALRQAHEAEKAKAAAEAAAAQAADEQAKRQAEEAAAATRQAEEDARRKAEAEAEAMRRADEALARAQAEKQKADEEAERQLAQMTEAGLKLAPLDRQHLQVALSAQGFDTRGNDGAFGPRSREMIGAWQKAHDQPSTGFLTAAQEQALVKDGAAAIQKYDDDQRQAEDDRRRAAESARAKVAMTASAVAPPAVAPPKAVTSLADFDGTWRGQIGDFTVRLVVAGPKGTLDLDCHGNSGSFSVSISPLGTFDAWISPPTTMMVGATSSYRQQVFSRLPAFSIPTGSSSCKGGKGSLVR